MYCTTLKDGKNHLRTYSRDKLEILGRGDVDHEDDETGPGRMGENAAIAWQPRGCLIAVSGVAASSSRNSTNNNAEKEEEKVPCVVLYEKNGLRRSSLLMRGFQGSKITHLSWSVDSLTLAISTHLQREAQKPWRRYGLAETPIGPVNDALKIAIAVTTQIMEIYMRRCRSMRNLMLFIQTPSESLRQTERTKSSKHANFRLGRLHEF